MMPINNWNWYRAVGTGGDHKGWIGDNPQVMRIDQTDKIIDKTVLI